ncbi:Hypothetical predicted protein [Podarcis lilfordi]|uniref:Uncharacterized protein n=1 Tax=Podarcis lilfordi TaxID=74358 RepID=A0AA35QPZ3_9SAUR|nr:Hypothetical predicted protein [Podarcis lilfordi]
MTPPFPGCSGCCASHRLSATTSVPNPVLPPAPGKPQQPALSSSTLQGAAPDRAGLPDVGLILKPYQDLVDVSEKKGAEALPPHRTYDCPIDLQPGAESPFGRIYALSAPELGALREYLDDNLARGFSRPSTSLLAPSPPACFPAACASLECFLECASLECFPGRSSTGARRGGGGGCRLRS